ncbi:hypothetical protein ACIGXM_35455 [Kitasatospora sp. NPDC052896]|uniref:hypothetical protein n=1 Tax=Kitasatospora sp. NPDC052896 TaxID=3364061 RepID=UPI0037C84077
MMSTGTPSTGTPQFRGLVAGGTPARGAGAGAGRPAPVTAVAPPPSAAAEAPDRRCGSETVTVSLRHGLETLDILRLRRACGSALQSPAGATISFVVPAGTAERWHLPGTLCTAGTLPASSTDPRWLVPPAADGTPAATDPWVLRSALCEAACTLTAGGLGPF